MKAKNISICAASLLLLLGCAVMLGWFLHIPALVQVFPGLVGMVFNTAFLFALIGITLLFANYIPPERYNVVLRIVGIFIAFVAIIILSQHILHYSIGIDEWAIKAWLTDPNPIPGSMAPNSTIAFILSGIVIFFLPIHHKKIINVLVPLFIFIILLIALTGAFIYILKLEYVFSWYNYTRMAVPTTVGFILVSLSSWCLVIQSPHFAHLYEGKEERKIMLLSGAVLVILTLITDLGCIAITTYSSFNLIHESLKISMLNKIAVFEAEIEGVEKNINKLMQNANLQQTVLHASQQETAPERQAFALLFSANDIAIKIVGQNGKILYEQGKFNEKPELAIPIKTNYNSTLLWENGFWLRFKVPIYANQQIIGEAIGESPLPIFSKFYLDYSTLGNL